MLLIIAVRTAVLAHPRLQSKSRDFVTEVGSKWQKVKLCPIIKCTILFVIAVLQAPGIDSSWKYRCLEANRPPGSTYNAKGHLWLEVDDRCANTRIAYESSGSFAESTSICCFVVTSFHWGLATVGRVLPTLSEGFAVRHTIVRTTLAHPRSHKSRCMS